MKKAFVLFALCLVLVLGAVSIAFFHLHQDRNQVTVTAETLAGDPAQAAGLTAKQSAQYNGRLRWDLTIPLDRPQDTVSDFSSRQPPAEGIPMGPSIYMSVPGPGNSIYSLSGSYSLESVTKSNPELAPLLPLFQEIAQQTPDGQTHSETITLRDYLDVYPLAVDITVSYPTCRNGNYSMGYLSKVWQDFFAFPIPADERWTISIQKDNQGDIRELTLEKDSLYATYSPNLFTVYLGGRLFFTLDGNSSGACVNTPGGFGLYSPALVWQDGNPYLELDVLSNVFPLPQGTVVLDLSASRDGQNLLLTTRLGETCTLEVIDPETMAVKQSLTIPDRDLTRSIVEEDFLLFWSDAQLHLYSLGNGIYTYVFSAPMEESLILGEDYLAAAWNGEKLALAAPADPTTYAPGLTLAVYTQGTLVYRGIYKTSLTDNAREDPDSPRPTGTVRMVNGAELALAWT